MTKDPIKAIRFQITLRFRIGVSPRDKWKLSTPSPNIHDKIQSSFRATPDHSPGLRDPESRNFKISGCPKFTNEVQHLLYKVLRWDKNMNSFRWNNVARLPGIAKPGKQSAKSRQLWIARHRL